MPNNQALQVFYGTIPLILVIGAAWFRNETLLEDILACLGGVEDFIMKAEKRLTVLETRAIPFPPVRTRSLR